MEVITPVSAVKPAPPVKEPAKSNDLPDRPDASEGAAEEVIPAAEEEEQKTGGQPVKTSEGGASDKAEEKTQKDEQPEEKTLDTEKTPEAEKSVEKEDVGTSTAAAKAAEGEGHEKPREAEDAGDKETDNDAPVKHEGSESGGGTGKESDKEAIAEVSAEQHAEGEKAGEAAVPDNGDPAVKAGADANSQPVKRKRGRPLKLDADGVPLRDKREKEKAEKRAARSQGEGKSVERPKKPKAESTSGVEKKRGRSPKLHADGTPLRETKHLDQEGTGANAEAQPERKQVNLEVTSPDILPASAKRKRARPQRLSDEEPLTSPKRAKTEKRSEGAKPQGNEGGAMPKRGRGRPRKSAPVDADLSGKRRGPPPKKSPPLDSSDEHHDAEEREKEDAGVSFGKLVGKRRTRPAKFHADGTPLVVRKGDAEKEGAMEVDAKEETKERGACKKKEEEKTTEGAKEEEKQDKVFTESKRAAKSGAGEGKGSIHQSLDEGAGEWDRKGEKEKSVNNQSTVSSTGKRRGRPPKNNPKGAATKHPATESMPAEVSEKEGSKPGMPAVGPAEPVPMRTSSARRKAARPQQAAC